jgi:hypothetical protein
LPDERLSVPVEGIVGFSRAGAFPIGIDTEAIAEMAG